MSKLCRGAGVAEGKGEDLIGQISSAKQQRAHRGFWGGIQVYETSVQARGRSCLQGNLWYSPPASVTSRLASVTFKMASKVLSKRQIKITVPISWIWRF